jgi:hypothetical protein
MRSHAHPHRSSQIDIEHFTEDIQAELLVPSNNARGVYKNMERRECCDELLDGIVVRYIEMHEVDARGGRRSVRWETSGNDLSPTC